MEGYSLLQGPCLFTDKGYNISVIIYKGCWIGLCVGVQKNVMTNEISEFGILNFFP